MPSKNLTAEEQRLNEDRQRKVNWKRWGPYLSDRQWGTVREDYSVYETAWEYLPHDHARSRAYRWGEDGLGGVCDRRQYICLALMLWNGKDPSSKNVSSVSAATKAITVKTSRNIIFTSTQLRLIPA
jgi:hypothetical protein